MASPQTENGYTMIANELLEAISRKLLSGDEHRLFWTILRKTYGFKKKLDQISLSQFVLATGINKQNVCRALSKLIKKNMIIRIDNKLSRSYSIQKDYTIWKPLSKQITLSKQIKDVIQIDNKTLSKQSTTKERDTKEIITKEYIYPQNFEDFWNPYPRKIEKKDAFTAWKQLTERQKLEAIVASENYAIQMKREGRSIVHIKHPKSFLNKDKERWKDYMEITKPYQVGENIHKSTHKDIHYWKDRVVKSAEINKELADEFKKARHAKDADRLEELENIGKEKIAEWSKQRQKKIQAI